jgi:hypothetical protein
MIGRKTAEELRNQRHIQHRDNTQVQRAAQFSGFAVQFLEKIFQLMKDGPGMFLKNQTAWSKQNSLPAALKQGHAKSRFQIPHLLRDTRLRDSQAVSRPAEVPRFGDREKIAEVADV